MWTLHATLVDKIPLKWLIKTTFYAQDQEESMLLGQLFIRLDTKKMDFGLFLAELLQLLHTEKQTNKRLEARIARLEKIVAQLHQK